MKIPSDETETKALFLLSVFVNRTFLKCLLVALIVGFSHILSLSH